MQDKTQRGGFSSRLGFVMAAAGSAVGMGNIWRFPYLAAQYGGGIFLVIYVLLAVTFGFSLMCAEIAIGRKTRLSAIGAYRALDKRFSFIGYLCAFVPTVILPYYCVVGGWVTHYAFAFLFRGAGAVAQDGYFAAFTASSLPPLIWFLLFVAMTCCIVLPGIQKGVERFSRIMMPLLVVMMVFVTIYTLCLPGALKGVKYYLTPDVAHLSWKTVPAAMGQMFYSMSLASAAMITYGSYMRKDARIDTSARQIEWFDTGVAFLAGLMIIPAVFVFSGGDRAALGQGPGLMFVTLPKVFEIMPGGSIIGAVFFLLVLFAALTSSISMYEAVVSFTRDRFGMSRSKGCALVFGICLLLGIPSSLGNGVWNGFRIIGMDFLSFCDFLSNSVLMPTVALLTCLFVGYAIGTQTLEEELELNGAFKNRAMFRAVIRYIGPVFILLILCSSVLNALGIVAI